MFHGLQEKARNKSISAEECYHFGVLCWMLHNLKNAAKLFETSIRNGHEKTEVMFGLAILHKQMLMPKAAVALFRRCQKARVPSIWTFLAKRELDRM
jgi:hypothetical protein